MSLLDEVDNPLIWRGDLCLRISSLGLELGTPTLEVGGYLALLRELPLSRIPSSLVLLQGHPHISLLMEKLRLLTGRAHERL